MVSFGSNAIEIVISAADRFSANMNLFEKRIKGLNSVVGKLRGPLLAIGAASVAAAGLSIKAFANFEKKMADVTTLMGKGESAAETYGDTVDKLGTEFAVSGGKVGVAAGLYQVVSAGFIDAADAAIILEEAVKASVGGSVEASVAITGLTQVINAYGLEATDAADVSDIMFQTVAKGVTTFAELNGALSTVLATASAAGIGFETVSAAIVTMTKNGLNANEATVSLNQTILGLIKPTEKLSVVLAEIATEQGVLSIEAQQATSDFISQQNELNSLTNAYDETTIAIGNMGAELDDLSDDMAINRVKIQELRLTARKEGRELTEAEIKDIDALELANDELSLSFNKLKIQEDDLKESQESQKQSVEEQKEAMVENSKIMKEAGTEAGEALLANVGFAETMRLIGEKADGSLTKLGEFFTNIRALKGALNLTGENAKKFDEAIAGMADRMGVADNATEVMGDTVENRFKKMQNNIEAVAVELGGKLSPVFEALMPIVGSAAESFGELDPVFQIGIVALGALAGAFVILAPAITAISGLIAGAGGLGAVLAILTGPIGIVIAAVALLALAWTTNFGGIQEKVQAVIDVISPLFDRVLGILQRLGALIIDKLTPAFTLFVELVSPIIQGLWDNIFKPTFDLIIGIINELINLFDVIVSALEGNTEPLENLLDDIAQGFTDFFTGIVDSAFKFGANLVNAIVDGIKSIGSLIAETFANLIPPEIRQFIDGGIDVLSSGISNLSSGVGGLIEPVDDLIISGKRVFKTAPDDNIAAFKGASPFGIGENQVPSIGAVQVQLINPVFTNDLSFQENGRKIGQETVKEYRRLKRT